MDLNIDEADWSTSDLPSDDFHLSTSRSGALVFSQPGSRNSSHISVDRDASRRRFANGPEAYEASAMLLQAFGLVPANALTELLAKREIRRKRYFLGNSVPRSRSD
jgi:hypothetical protein